MAYTKLRDLIELAVELRASSVGLTMQDMMTKRERSRATVERMLNGLDALNMEVKKRVDALDEDHHLAKRWLIEDEIPSELLMLEPTERSALERHLQTLPDGAESRALNKLLADIEPLGKALAVNAAELIDRTTHIGQIGPRLEVDPTLMRAIENGILGFQRLKIKYRAQGRTKAAWRKVEPLGLLFGRFGYLVANNTKTKMKPLTYRLDLIEAVEPLDEWFELPAKFKFKEWAEDSYGIFHGDKLLNVKLRFSGEAARRAEKVKFHSSQLTSKGKGNTLIVELLCKGHWKLIHELLNPDWLGNVVIEEPEELKQEYEAYLSKSALAIEKHKSV